MEYKNIFFYLAVFITLVHHIDTKIFKEPKLLCYHENMKSWGVILCVFYLFCVLLDSYLV